MFPQSRALSWLFFSYQSQTLDALSIVRYFDGGSPFLFKYFALRFSGFSFQVLPCYCQRQKQKKLSNQHT